MIAILAATWQELQQLTNHTDNFTELDDTTFRYGIGEIINKSVLIAETGVGIKKARTSVSYVIQKHRPELIIIAGHGGALSPELKVGDIVVGESVISLLKDEKKTLFSLIPDLEVHYKKGDILTENRFIHESAKKKKLHEQSGASVVDMETWGVVEASMQSSVPVMGIRSVSDEYFENLPDMGELFNSAGKFDPVKAARYFIFNPRLIFPYLRFRFVNSKKSADSLSTFLLTLIHRLNDTEIN